MPTLLVIADDLFLSINPPLAAAPKSLDYYNLRFTLYGDGGTSGAAPTSDSELSPR
jgi:hypothetical protein